MGMIRTWRNSLAWSLLGSLTLLPLTRKRSSKVLFQGSQRMIPLWSGAGEFMTGLTPSPWFKRWPSWPRADPVLSCFSWERLTRIRESRKCPSSKRLVSLRRNSASLAPMFSSTIHGLTMTSARTICSKRTSGSAPIAPTLRPRFRSGRESWIIFGPLCPWSWLRETTSLTLSKNTDSALRFPPPIPRRSLML